MESLHSDSNISFYTWADQVLREAEVVIQGGMQNEPNMGHVAEGNASVNYQNQDYKNGDISVEDYDYQNMDFELALKEKPLKTVAPSNHITTVSIRMEEAQQKQHVVFKCPPAEKLKINIERALRAVGQDQLRVPDVEDLTSKSLAKLCRYSSEDTDKIIDSLLGSMGRDEIVVLPVEGQTKFALSQRVSGWSVCLSPRKDSNQHDANYRHNLVRTSFRSTRDVLRFILYEGYPPKSQKTDITQTKKRIVIIKQTIKRKIEEDVPSMQTFEKRLYLKPSETSQQILQG